MLLAAGERYGDAQLLAGLKRTMQPADFEHIGGALLSELGRTAPSDPFSFAKFVTGYKKLSDPAKNVLFSPQHRADIEAIFGMGKHLRQGAGGEQHVAFVQRAAADVRGAQTSC